MIGDRGDHGVTELPPTANSRLFLLLATLFLLAGCAGQAAHREGLEMVSQGQLEAGLAKLEQAMREDPDNLEYRVHYLNTRDEIIGRLLGDAQRERSAGRVDAAEGIYARILKLDPNNPQAAAGMAAIGQARRHAALLADASSALAANDIETAQRRINEVLQDDPRQADARALQRQIDEKSGRYDMITPALRQSFKKPVTLEFRDAGIKQVLEALSRHSGLNFVLDKDVPPNLSVTVFLRNVSVESALDVILTTNQLNRRILNDTTLLIYPDTAAKQSDLQDLVVKNFFLANADAKQVMNMLKTVLKAKNLFADDKLNLLIMRDTPDMIRLAERLVATQDVAEPEVMLEVEVLEVQRSRLLNLGIQFPDQFTLTPLPSNGTTLTLQDLKNLNSSRTGLTMSPMVINLQRTVGDTNLLANPRLRTHNREKALIRIGDRVPVITTTATSTGFVSENVQYIDVGLRLEIEPTIFPNDEVSIKLGLEVSSVTRQITSSSGTVSYQIGGRNASTVLRLKDGETQMLGGLINDEDRKNANRFPGLGDLPVVGRLFSSQSDDHNKTELLLFITPHLVRGLAPPASVPAEFWSGTENTPRLRAPSIPVLPENAGNITTPSAAPPAPAANAGPTSLSWDGAGAAKAGSTFRMTLKASSSQPVNSFPLQIKYDPAVFEAVNVVPGNFMSQSGTKVDVTKRVEGEAGMLYLTQTRSGAAGAGGARGAGTLAEIEFRALKPSTGSPIIALPAAPLGPGKQGLGQTQPAVADIVVTQ